MTTPEAAALLGEDGWAATDGATDAARRARADQLAEVLGAAREMFGRFGYHATSMEDIALRLHVSKPTLYRHFPGKLELYRVVAQDAAREMVRAVRAAAQGPGDNESRCRAAMRAYFDAVCSPDDVAHLFVAVDARTSPEIAELVDRASAACVDAIADVVAEESGLPRDRARLVAAGLVGTCTATARETAAAGHDRGEALELTAQLLWRGIGSFPLDQDGPHE